MAERAPFHQFDHWLSRTHDLPGAAFQRLTDEVAYLKLSSIVAADATSYIRNAAGMRVLVIDIRNYPSEFVVFALGRHLVAERTEFARFTKADPANPGVFRWMDPMVLEPKAPRFGGKIVILVDETSRANRSTQRWHSDLPRMRS